MTKLMAPMVGKVVSVDVQVGEKVQMNQKVVTIEAMKMKIPVVAPVAGTVEEIKVSVGQSLDADDVIASIAEGG